MEKSHSALVEPSAAQGQPAARPGSGDAATKPGSAQQQQQAAGDPLSPRGGAGKAAPAPAPAAAVPSLPGEVTEPLLPMSSEDCTPVPSVELAPALTAEEAERRKRRRDRWEREAEAKQRWELQRRLVDISTDVEFLAREVSLGMAAGLGRAGRGQTGGIRKSRARVCDAATCPLPRLQVERVRNEMDVPLPSLSELNEAERTQVCVGGGWRAHTSCGLAWRAHPGRAAVPSAPLPR